MTGTDAFRQDLKGALRGLWKSPGFAVAALVTLSLGIGATSAIFSVVKAVLLTPLPYDAPEQRVMVWSKWVSFEKTWVSSQEVFDYRELARTMTDVAFWANTSQNLTDAGEPVRLTVGLVSANTFDVLGTRPLLGRTFNADDESPQRSAGRGARLRAVGGAVRGRSRAHRPPHHAQRRAGGGDRRHARGLPPADRLHPGCGRADAVVAPAADRPGQSQSQRSHVLRGGRPCAGADAGRPRPPSCRRLHSG